MTPPATADPSWQGPVSAVLETELRAFVTRHGVAVWLDPNNHYSDFVDTLVTARAARNLPYDVHAFRGSYLELMLALEEVAAGTEKVGLVLHLPGHTEESVRQTPLLELYLAGRRFRKGLETLVEEAAAGRVAPVAIDTFLAQPGLTLAAANAWLHACVEQSSAGAAISASLSTVALLEQLMGRGGAASEVGGQAALWDVLAARLGLTAAWREAITPPVDAGPRHVALVAASWALAVEYTHDLQRAPVHPLLGAARALPASVVQACREVAESLRTRNADTYAWTVGETEALLADEVAAARAEDLGSVDTFRFEEEVVLRGALDALGRREWDRAATWAHARTSDLSGGGSFWLRRDPGRADAWKLVGAAATLGQAIARAGVRLGVTTTGGDALGAAVAAYVERGAAVDQAHRKFEELCTLRQWTHLPEFESVRARLNEVRAAWHEWADGWAREFSALCRREGFLPDARLQQRTLFDDVVLPMTREHGTTAYFVVDALRYEMAEELARHIGSTQSTTVLLKARLAELPTVTAVGMNALAPVVSDGRMTLARAPDHGEVLGFRSGDFVVSSPDLRKRAMQGRVGGSTCPWLTLSEAAGPQKSLNAQIRSARLVVVHSKEIDEAGESGMGPVAFESVLHQLRAAWHNLWQAGVRRFVFTSDHGFLLLDERNVVLLPHGRRTDPQRRHVFSTVAADHPGEARVALSDLGYAEATGHLMFPESLAVFDRGRRAASFVHGGNSLQERVIPVLTVVHRAPVGATTEQYRVSVKPRGAVAGMQSVEVELAVEAQAGLGFAGPQEVELALRALDADGVQVDLIDVRGPARLGTGAVYAKVGEPFELFFRLVGPNEDRVRVEVYHPVGTDAVRPTTLPTYFAVSAMHGATQAAARDATHDPAPDAAAAPKADAWLEAIDDPKLRRFYEALAAHRTVTEPEAVAIFGSARALRKQEPNMHALGATLPFVVHTENVDGIKRYRREG